MSSPAVAEGNYGFVAAHAALAAAAGDRLGARRSLAQLPPGGAQDLPPSSGWLVTVIALVEAAAVLGDATLATQCYEALGPYAGLPAMASIAIASFGPVEWSLAKAAQTAGLETEAADHEQRALVECVALGEVVLEERIRADLEARERAPGSPITLRRAGKYWQVSTSGHHATVPDTIGMRYLAELASVPGVAVSALDLVSRVRFAPAERTGAQSVLDRQALSALRDALATLDEEIAEAAAWHDDERRARLSDRRSGLEDELRKAINLRGRSRAFVTPLERARVSVRKALLRAVTEIEETDAEIGAFLRDRLHTGYDCVLRR
jgi:hypothetical protein